MLRYLIFITIGILLYLLLNIYNTFNIGVPLGVRSPQISERACATQTQKYFIIVPVFNALNEQQKYYIETPFNSEDEAKSFIQITLNEYKDKNLYYLNTKVGFNKFSVQEYFVVSGLPNLNTDTLLQSFPLVFDCLQAVLCKKYDGDIIEMQQLARTQLEGSYQDLDTYFIEEIYKHYTSLTYILNLKQTHSEREYDVSLGVIDPKSYVFLNRLDDAKFNCGSGSSCCIMR
tara:strand:- start:362 stop:1054 length:693 start_codon:yes stop_codon:yes gene_type:complete